MIKKITLLFLFVFSCVSAQTTELVNYDFTTDAQSWSASSNNSTLSHLDDDPIGTAAGFNARGAIQADITNAWRGMITPSIDISSKGVGTYNVTYRVRVLSGGTINTKFYFKQVGGGTPNFTSTQKTFASLSGSTGADGEEWLEYSHEFDITAAGNITIEIIFGGASTNPSSVLVDDVVITHTPFTGHSLTTSITGAGSITKSPDETVYSDNTDVTLTAVPATHWSFDSWSGDLTGSTNPDILNMGTADKSVTANFIIDPAFDYDFTFESDGDEEGWVSTGATATVASGYLDFSITGTNPALTLGNGFSVPAGTYNTVAITLTNNTTNTLLRLIHPKNGGGTQYIDTYIAPNAVSTTYTINLTDDGWSGDIDDLYFSVKAFDNGAAATGASVQFERIQFSSGTTEKHIYDFDGITAEDWSFVRGSGNISNVAGGYMTYEPKSGTALIKMGANHVNTSTVDAVRIVVENQSTDDDELRVLLPNGDVVSTSIDVSAAEKTYELYLGDETGWTGNLSQITIRFVDASNSGQSSATGNFIINSIEFFDGDPLGVDDINNTLNVELYPNPVSDMLQISEEVSEVEIYNVLGQKIISLSDVKSIDTSNFENGSYFAKITSKEGLTATKRFLKN